MEKSLAIVLILVIAIGLFIVYRINKENFEQSLYERLGGVYNIAAVVDYFSDAIINDPLVGKDSPNPFLREWSRSKLDRLPGLKFMRTLWVCAVSGGPQSYVPTVKGTCPFSSSTKDCDLNLDNAHAKLKITSAEFDRVASILSESLDHFKVPQREKMEVLNAFAAHKDQVVKK